MRNTGFIRKIAATCRSLPADFSGSNMYPNEQDKMYPNEQDKRPMLRTPAAAAYCGSSTSTFEKLRLSGGGPRYLKLGRRVAYDPDDLDAWLASHRRTSTSDRG